MYKVLGMSWDNVMDSEYVFKSSWKMKTIEFKGKNLEDSYGEQSSVLIVYNVANGLPILLVERLSGNVDVTPEYEGFKDIPKEFVMHIDHYEHKSRGDIEYTDIVLVRRELYDSIIKEEGIASISPN